MPSLLESTSQAITPQLKHQFSELLGLDESQVTQAADLAAPLLLTSLSNEAVAPAGADEVLATLQELPDDPVDALDSGLDGSLLQRILGIGAPKVAEWLQYTTGINVAPLLPLVTPFVLSAIANAVKSDKLDAAGLATLLKSEKDKYARANPQLSSEINAALDLGANVNERAARIRAKFTDEEFQVLSKTPPLAGYAVMMSSLSGPVGINKEIAELLTAMQELGGAAEPDSLVGLVSREFTSPEQINELGATRENAAAMMRDACLGSLRILNEKETYDETQAFKEFVVNVSTRVANAAIDGGFMSIGGKAVTKEEQMTLNLIAAALAYQPE